MDLIEKYRNNIVKIIDDGKVSFSLEKKDQWTFYDEETGKRKRIHTIIKSSSYAHCIIYKV